MHHTRLIQPLQVLVLLASLILTNPSETSAAEPRKKNVLFIVSDDLNNLLGCYGDPQAKTPNIDKLAQRGVRFDRSYCAFPLCGPSRNSLLTGLYPNSTGIFANALIFRQTIPDQPSLPQVFRQNGYLAVRIGKLFHYHVPKSIGTNGHDDPASWEIEMNPAGVDRTEEEPKIFSLTPGQFGGTLSWYASPKADAEHTDGKNASDAEWVLERCAKDRSRPFFLAVGFFRPHTPYVSPETYFKKYNESEMRVVQGVAEDQADLPKAALGSYKKEQDKLTDELRRKCLQAYYASISFMDAQVGRVVNTLDRLGLADDTVIVFTSDHGYHTGEHGLWQKMSLFEESARVPMLIVSPGHSKGETAAAPVAHIDLFPTLTELCGIPAPKNLHGQSLVPMLKNPAHTGRGWALTQVQRGSGNAGRANRGDIGSDGEKYYGYSLRTPKWRYTEWDEGKRGRELYDHDTDPKELKNLAEKTEHQATVEDLSKKLRSIIPTTFPESGRSPEIKPSLWLPAYID